MLDPYRLLLQIRRIPSHPTHAGCSYCPRAELPAPTRGARVLVLLAGVRARFDVLLAGGRARFDQLGEL
jgi:hypothetical protein